MSNTIAVTCADKKASKFKREIKREARNALFILGKKNVCLEIMLIDATAMRGLNKRFRKKDVATNVLSFRETEPFPHPELKQKRCSEIGEIYLNCSYIKRQAKKKNVPLRREIRFMLVHGMLHVLGYDHVRKSDRISMKRLEQKLLQ